MNLNFYKRKSAWRLLLFSWLTTVLLVSQVYATGAVTPAATINGKVTSADDGSGLPGVNVYVKGTQNGTITDGDGKYTLSVTDENSSVLVFSYIGFSTQEVSISGRTTVDVTLQPNAEALGEVVVTALGIKRDEASLGFSVGKIKGDDLNHVAQENMLNSLAGRVPGVTINNTGVAGSSVKMNIRGVRSLTGDNQPLFVVDGVQMVNGLNNVSQVGSDNRVDYGNAISDLNSENIESMTVLKGPSAAALYGSRAGNGVVIITTKNGSANKKAKIELTSNTVFDIPYKFLKMNKNNATGILPFTPDNNPYPGGVLVIDETSAGGIGPQLNKGYNAIQWNSPKDANGDYIATPLVSHPNNVENFFKTGITTTNGVAVSNNTGLMSYRISYANMSHQGNIPNSDLFKNTLGLNTSLKVTQKLSVSTNLDFSRSNSNNRPAGNRGTNPMQWAYAVSPHIDIRDLKDYWVEGQEGLIQRTQDNAKNYNNPYYLANEVNNSFTRDRVFGNIKAEYQFTPELSLMGRYALDTYNEKRETKITSGYIKERNGSYGVNDIKQYERNADFLLTYSKTFNQLSLTASAGGNARYVRSEDLMVKSKDGAGLVLPNVFTVGNIASDKISYTSYSGEKAVHSVYGLVNLGYKDMLYLDVTARNDWSSTLPKENRSYFYPSASLSVLINEMVDIPSVSLLKLRAGVAQVGNDTGPYNLYQTLQKSSDWGSITRLNKPSGVKTPSLKPEQVTSFEYGTDISLFNNRVSFSATLYNTRSENQILDNKISTSSGFSDIKFNAGLLESTGIELVLGGTPIDKGDFRLDLSANYTRYRTKIVELAPGMPIFTFWEDAKGGAWTYVGDEIGDLYDAELVTVKDQNSPYNGYPILDENGSWQAVGSKNSKNKIGNFNPDFILGMQTSLTYKRFSLNMSFDWRNGGNFVSQTYRYSESDLRTQRFLDMLINPGNMSGDQLRNYLVDNDLVVVRDRFNIVGGPTAEYGGFPFEFGGNTYPYGVFNPGVIAEYDDDGNIVGYTENLGGEGTKIIPYGDNYPWDFMKAATFDASFIKLREISLGYSIPTDLIKRFGLQAAYFSIYSRNIMLWTKAKIGIDPETAFQQEANAQGGTQLRQGIERYNVNPFVMPIGFKLGLTF